MSFAPAKKNRKESLDSMKHSRYSSHESASNLFSSGIRTRTSIDCDFSYRLDVLDSNIHRINQQQEALIPLNNMLDMTASFGRYDKLVREVHKQNCDSEDRLERIEDLMKEYRSNLENSMHKINGETRQSTKPDTKIIDRNIKNVVTEMSEKDEALNKLRLGMESFQKMLEKRIDTELAARNNKLEPRLEKNAEDFRNTMAGLHSGINVGFERMEEAVKDMYEKVGKFKKYAQANSGDTIMDDVKELITKRFDENFEYIRDKYNKDIDRLYREFGILRVEMGLINEEKKQAKLQPYLQLTGEVVNPSERRIKINNLEQEFYINELEKFNKENTQRLMYELQTFDEKLDRLKTKYQSYKERVGQASPRSPETKEEWNRLLDETEVIGETYTSLKYQIEGMKKKYFFDVKKIEDNMEKINKIKKEIQDELKFNPKLEKIVAREMQTVDDFPDKIKNLMDEINLNLTTAFTRLEMVEDKIQENQELLLPKSQ